MFQMVFLETPNVPKDSFRKQVTYEFVAIASYVVI